MNALPQTPSTLFSAPLEAVAGFAIGCGAGIFLGTPVLLTGAVVAAGAVAHIAIGAAVKHIGQKYNWNVSSALLIKTTLCAVAAVAAIGAAVALGIIGSAGSAILGGVLILALSSSYAIAYNARNEELNHRNSWTFRKRAANLLV